MASRTEAGGRLQALRLDEEKELEGMLGHMWFVGRNRGGSPWRMGLLAAPLGRGGRGMDPDGEAKWKERWLAQVGVVVKARRGFFLDQG